MAPLSPAATALRRELLTRRWLLAAGPAALLIGLLLPESSAIGWYPFVALVLLPVLAVALALGQQVEADRWWAGLHGAPLAAAALRWALHLGLLLGCGLAALLLAFSSTWEGGGPPAARIGWVAVTGLLAGLAALYGSSATARRGGGGLGLLAGPLVLIALVGLGGLADWRVGAWSALEGGALRLVGLAALFAVTALRAEGRLQRPGRPAAVYGAAAAFTALSVGAHGLWSGRPLLLPPTPADLRADGEAALYVHGPAAILAPRRALLWADGAWSTVGPVGAVDAAFGPEGALAFVTGDLFSRQSDLTLSLHAQGQRRDCRFAHAGHDGERWAFPTPGDATAVLVFSPDGAAVATRLTVDGESGVAVAWADGRCEFDPGAPRRPDAIAWTAAGAGWSLALSPASTAPSERGAAAPGPHQATLADGRLSDPESGRSAPAPAIWSTSAPLVLAHRDGLRAFYDGGPILDLGPEGERARVATTLLDAVWP